MVRLSAREEFVLADIPGLIEGAHEGAGLGDRFLGHVERCAVLLHLVDGAAGDVVRAWRTVRAELAAYGGGLAEKPEIVALNKADAMTPRQIAARRAALARASGAPVHAGLRRDRPGRAGGAAARWPMTSPGRGRRGRTRHDARARRRPPARREDRQRAGRGCRQAAPRAAWLAGIAADIAALRARGADVIVVSSGAIALARRTRSG